MNSSQTLPILPELFKDGLIDVKLTSNKVWILKEAELIMQDLFFDDMTE